MDTELKAIGARIKEAREAKKMSQMELAGKVGITAAHLSNAEHGKTNISLVYFRHLTQVLGVSADWLLQNDTESVNRAYQEEMNELLEGCSTTERAAITDVAKRMKASYEQIKSTIE